MASIGTAVAAYAVFAAAFLVFLHSLFPNQNSADVQEQLAHSAERWAVIAAIALVVLGVLWWRYPPSRAPREKQSAYLLIGFLTGVAVVAFLLFGLGFDI